MRPNFFLITLDCVRADRLGCYGYPGVETLNIDELASSGILFEQVVSHAPNTWVSHASVFTGCFPPFHGLRGPDHRLAEDVVTMAEWFSAHGWSTAGFPGTNLVGRAQGLDRGFHYFDDNWVEEGAARGEKVLWRGNWKNALIRLEDWMERTPGPFFVWLHYVDTHHLPEINLPEYYRTRFSSKWQFYDGKISYADSQCVGHVMALMERSGISDRTAVVVFADHGEELQEEDRPIHDGGLGEGVMRVPLVMRLPGSWATGGKRISTLVCLADIFPTLCDLAGISSPQGINGVSLKEAVEDTARVSSRTVYMENLPKGFIGARSKEWKLVLKVSGGGEGVDKASIVGLYHLPTDPREQRDLSGLYPAVVEWLMEECRMCTMSPKTISSVDEEQQRSLRAVLEGLGYL